MSIFKDQADFMRAGGQEILADHAKGITPDALADVISQTGLYRDLIVEETSEFMEEDKDVNLIKEAIDILVVTAGWLNSICIDPQKAWDIVHSNNMLKVAEKPEYDDNGKIKKSKASIQRKQEMMDQLSELL